MFLFLLPPVLPHPLDLLFPEDYSAVAKFLDGIGPDPGGFVDNFMKEPIARSASGKMKEVEEVATSSEEEDGFKRPLLRDFPGGRGPPLSCPRGKAFPRWSRPMLTRKVAPLGKETVFFLRNGPHQAAG